MRAMSSGLGATMGLPAQASAPAGPAAPATAPLAVQPAVALTSGLMSAAGSAQSASAEVTAPAAAKVKFADSAFKAIAPRRAGHASGFSGSAFGSAKGSSIVAIAARYLGVRYVYGGTNPGTGWDCSGATSYIYGQVGIHIPRTANQQMLASHRISASQAKAGDLVFFLSGGHAYHVGIVAGPGMMYDAGHTGVTFTKRAIYSSAVVYGRF